MRRQKGVKKSFIVILIFLILFSPYGQIGLTQASEREFNEEVDISVQGVPTEEQVILNVETTYFNLVNLEFILPDGIKYDEESTKALKSDSTMIYNNEENSLNIHKEESSPLSATIILTGFNVGENSLEVRGHLNDGSTESLDFFVTVESDPSDADEGLKESDTEENKENNSDQSDASRSGDDEGVEEANPESDKSEESSDVNSEDSSSEEESKQQKETNQGEDGNDDQDEPIFKPMVGDLNVDIDVSPLNANVLAGNDAAYKLVFKTTGSITEYTNAIIIVDLPLSSEVNFNQSLSELRIAGVEPTFDSESSQLIYQFDTLQAGQTYENIIKLQTTNGLIASGTELDVQASFQADQFEPVQDLATVVIDASTQSLLLSDIRKLGGMIGIYQFLIRKQFGK
ncbi:peptidoglycan bound protein Lmo2179 homolog [Bacillus sp. JCM 19047]|nr:peptidoglycan bound protein Lmo2179 homolog [Bacillus sp. JCM 19047]